MVAQAMGGGPIEALCLSEEQYLVPGTPNRNFVRADFSCSHWKINSHGAVDEPPDYGETARAAYAEEEGE